MKNRTVAFISIFFGLAILVIALINLQPSTAGKPASLSLPTVIAGQDIVTRVTGAQALEEVSGLHGKEFELVSGTVGSYGSQNQVIIWVTGTKSDSAAAELVDAMTLKIAKSESPFSPTGEQEDGDRTVYLLDGVGQAHFYFQSDRLVVWVAADPGLAKAALSQVLAFYP